MPDFRFLPSASVLASHYSASASSFPSLPGFTSQWFSRCPAPLSLPRLPFPFHPVSRASLPVLSTRLSVRFLSLFPASLPTAVPQVLPLRSRLRAFPLPICFLSSASVPLPATQPLFLPFRSSRLRLTVASTVPDSALASSLSTIRPAWSPMRSFRLPVLGSLFVSFRSSLLRFPQPFHRCFPYALAFGLFHFPAAFFRPRPFRFQLLSLCCFLSVLPGSASQWLPRCTASALTSSAFPVLPSLVSHAFFPGSRTRLPVCFLSSLPASLPQLFHRCFPSFPLPLVRFSSGLFPSRPRSFVRSRSVLTTQPSVLSFPFFPVSPDGGSSGAFRSAFASRPSPSVTPVSMRSFRFWYSAFCNSFLRLLSRLTVATSASQPSSYWTSAAPLGFRFRFRLLGLSVLNFSVRLRPRIYYHRNHNLSTSIFYLFQLLYCILQPTCCNIMISSKSKSPPDSTSDAVWR